MSSTTSSCPPNSQRMTKLVARQAFAGMLWSKQYYHYVVTDWLEGDPAEPAPPPQRLQGRNHEWPHCLHSRHDLDARQMGVSLVRFLGSGFPLRRPCPRRSGIRQGADHLDAARVVHAPERADPGLRVGFRRRESAGAVAGGTGRVRYRASAHRRGRLRISWNASFKRCCSTSPGG